MQNPACSPGSRVRYRANIKISKEQDQELNNSLLNSEVTSLHNALTESRNDVRVVELFAGAGGMGVGSLMAGDQKKGFRIIHSAEIQPIYLKSLENNYKYFSSNSVNRLEDCIPSEFTPVDLTQNLDRQVLYEAVKKANGVDLVIGGTPCQGFSPSNRSNWNSKNTYNRLVEYFIQCALELAPKAILLENVQGILWTPRSNRGKKPRRVTVVDYIARKFTEAGYVLFPAVLDAAWYGVPQHRNRFFLLALHKDLGYKAEHFSEWGPFPLPRYGAGKYDYVTVKEAIADLPVVENGESQVIQPYKEPTQEQLSVNPFLRQMREMAILDTIEGHIVSKQADYVIDRYRYIPAGGNWQNIRHMMTNYSDIERTHSNIYRRLRWEEPSITIGNYRKSMIIHPDQQRGLSLREASRLQSLPDWFTFCGATSSSKGLGLMHKQQQLANTVSFLLTLAIAKYILKI